MVCNFQRKSEKVSGETIRAAIRYYEVCLNQRQTALKFGLTRSLLQKYLKWDHDEIPKECSQGRFKPIFNMDQEDEIIRYVNDLAQRFYAMTRGSLRDLAYRLAVENNIPNTFKNGTAGEGWLNSFLRRHEDRLSLRTGTPTSLARITSFRKEPVYRFFDLLEAIVAEKGFCAETIFNMDESGFKIVPNNTLMRIAPRGMKFVPIATAKERGDLCTAICCFSASGKYIPPLFIFPQSVRHLCLDAAPPYSIWMNSLRGWSTSVCFVRWIKHFRKYATEDTNTPILLIMDNHSSHINYEAVQYARKHNIELLTLPPHSTHKLQPLDVSFFSPLKSKWESYLAKWHMTHMHQKPSLQDIPSLFGFAFADAAKRETAVNGFRATGIWQLDTSTNEWHPNRHIFDNDFMSEDTPPPQMPPRESPPFPSSPRGDSPPSSPPRGDSPPSSPPRGDSPPSSPPRGDSPPSSSPRGLSSSTSRESRPFPHVRAHSSWSPQRRSIYDPSSQREPFLYPLPPDGPCEDSPHDITTPSCGPPSNQPSGSQNCLVETNRHDRPNEMQSSYINNDLEYFISPEGPSGDQLYDTNHPSYRPPRSQPSGVQEDSEIEDQVTGTIVITPPGGPSEDQPSDFQHYSGGPPQNQPPGMTYVNYGLADQGIWLLPELELSSHAEPIGYTFTPSGTQFFYNMPPEFTSIGLMRSQYEYENTAANAHGDDSSLLTKSNTEASAIIEEHSDELSKMPASDTICPNPSRQYVPCSSNKRRPIVDYSSSSDEEQQVETSYTVEEIDEPEEYEKLMLVGQDESLEDIEHVDAIILTAKNNLPVGPSKFSVGPHDIEKQMQLHDVPSTSTTRKPRRPQQSELLTSDSVTKMLSDKDKEKKRKKTSSDSDERRKTRTTTLSEKLQLRSGKRL